MNDYNLFLEEFGLTDELVKDMAAIDNVVDIKGFPHYVSESTIEGYGLFSGDNFKIGEFIMPALVGDKRTIAGRYVNHSGTPNCIFADVGHGDLSLLSVKRINKDEEFTIDYRQALLIGGKIMPCFNFNELAENHGLDLTKFTIVEKIQIIEWIIINKIGNQVDDLITTHTIHGGIYARQMDAPAGYLITGKTHIKDHICTLAKGEITVLCDDGIKKLVAPVTFASKSGIKRIGYVHKDCSWIAYHATDKLTLDEIEDEIFMKDELKNIKWVDKLFNKTLEVLA